MHRFLKLSFETNEMASPTASARPVRPIRWTYSSAGKGKS
ncbi:Uncharacterised protein [Vibrio cholerae]|nr:Uncharacterised protein [Vibrio cholerae]